MSSFSFNFLPSTTLGDSSDSKARLSVDHESISLSPTDHLPVSEIKTPFVWQQGLASKFLQKCSLPLPAHDWIRLNEDTNGLARVLERSHASNYKETDLIPGVYEGGDVVWECSLDLCRYLHDQQVDLQGSVLELGCGHGLPGCYVLRQAKKAGNDSTFVCFTDFNEFVLDATMSNIALNIMSLNAEKDTQQEETEELSRWLAKHAPLGSGDWNALSQLLDDAISGDVTSFPEGLPIDGYFDCILAAETTYSTTAAMDTARFITKHLKKGSGVAYIATKRYYFGIGGGSVAFREGLQLHETSRGEFQVDILQVYDNGAGNIRELLRVQSMTRSVGDAL